MGEPLHQTVLVDIFDAAAAFTRVKERLIRCALTSTNPAGIRVDYGSGSGGGGGGGGRDGTGGGLGVCIVAAPIAMFGAFSIYATAASKGIGIGAAQVLR